MFWRPFIYVTPLSELPEAVVDTALDEDREHTVPRDLHGRVCDLAAGRLGCLNRGVDVVHQDVGPDHGRFGLVHRRADAKQTAAGNRGGTGIPKPGVWFAEAHAMELGVGRTDGLDVGRDDLEILDLYGHLPSRT